MVDNNILAKARNYAWRLLRERPRSIEELKKRLKLKGYEAALIEGIVTDLEASGDLNDAKFAAMWVESRMHRNPVGDIVLRRELKLKGVAESIISCALEAKKASYDEYEIALKMAREQFKRFEKLDNRKAMKPFDKSPWLHPERSRGMKRVYDFLMRRGFEFELITNVMEELSAE